MAKMECQGNCRPAPDASDSCFCITLDRPALAEQLRAQLGEEGEALLGGVHRHLFADSPAFVPRAEIERMRRIVAAIQRASALPGYRDAAVAWAPQIARFDPGPLGAFMGYDFHLGADGPRLIEINTNAGGAFVNAHLAQAQAVCCGSRPLAAEAGEPLARFEAAVRRMFESEWRRQRGGGRPGRIAIVDERPQAQYLYPEFRLAQELLQRAGIETLILDPAELDYRDGMLRAGDRPIDLVYNRLVDFSFDAGAHASLRQAYLDGAAVFTPNPRNHALLADKRNLSLLCDPARLRAWGLAAADAALLAEAVPATRLVTPEQARRLWEERRGLFFKPVAGHGSKGVYRGSKLTTGVFDQISAGGYIAQALVPPSERTVSVDGVPTPLKVDLRLYTYGDELLLPAARLYRGQTTNLRTPGGGFAPVFPT